MNFKFLKQSSRSSSLSELFVLLWVATGFQYGLMPRLALPRCDLMNSFSMPYHIYAPTPLFIRYTSFSLSTASASHTISIYISFVRIFDFVYVNLRSVFFPLPPQQHSKSFNSNLLALRFYILSSISIWSECHRPQSAVISPISDSPQRHKNNILIKPIKPHKCSNDAKSFVATPRKQFLAVIQITLGARAQQARSIELRV